MKLKTVEGGNWEMATVTFDSTPGETKNAAVTFKSTLYKALHIYSGEDNMIDDCFSHVLY